MSHSLFEAISDFIFISDPPQKCDVIFVPGGSSPLVPEYASKLYLAGFAPVLLPSGKYSVKKEGFAVESSFRELYPYIYQTECEFYSDIFLRAGIPESAILKEDQAGHTRDNADFSRLAVDNAGISVKKAILVCKSFHARRSLCFYQLAFPETEFFVCPVDTHGISRENWYLTDKGLDRVFGEVNRCGWQFLDDLKSIPPEKRR